MDTCERPGHPVLSAEKFLDFVEARNAVSFDNMNWDGTTLTFDFRTLIGGQDLTVMVPARNLLSIGVYTAPVSYTTRQLRGVIM